MKLAEKTESNVDSKEVFNSAFAEVLLRDLDISNLEHLKTLKSRVELLILYNTQQGN